MRERKGFSTRVEEFLSGKGFYIVLFVCVAIIGVSAWLLLFSQHSPLASGGEGDYLDVMGDVDDPAGDDKTGKTDTQTQEPEHQVPAPSQNTLTPNQPEGEDRDAVTVQPKPQEQDKPDKPDEPVTPEADPDEGKVTDVKDITFIWPLNGEVTMAYSPTALIYDKTMGDWRVHKGIDLAARLGTKVLCCANGTVTKVEEDSRYGTVVEIDHGAGLVSTYANLAGTPTVKVGDAVTGGSVIGSVGSTSLYETGDDAHLHFALTLNGESVDPSKYLPKK